MIFSPYENLGIWDLKKYGLRSVALNKLAINVLGGAFFKKNTLLARNQQACHQCVWVDMDYSTHHTCTLPGSNRRPMALKSVALTTELRRQLKIKFP